MGQVPTGISVASTQACATTCGSALLLAELSWRVEPSADLSGCRALLLPMNSGTSLLTVLSALLAALALSVTVVAGTATQCMPNRGGLEGGMW